MVDPILGHLEIAGAATGKTWLPVTPEVRAKVEALAAAGLIELDPTGNLVRLTDRGRQAVASTIAGSPPGMLLA